MTSSSLWGLVGVVVARSLQWLRRVASADGGRLGAEEGVRATGTTAADSRVRDMNLRRINDALKARWTRDEDGEIDGVVDVGIFRNRTTIVDADVVKEPSVKIQFLDQPSNVEPLAIEIGVITIKHAGLKTLFAAAEIR